MTTAVFQIVSPWFVSRSSIDDTITILYLRAKLFISTVDGPVSASSANSHHGCFSRVQKANGIAANENETKINFYLLHSIECVAYSMPLGNKWCWHRMQLRLERFQLFLQKLHSVDRRLCRWLAERWNSVQRRPKTTTKWRISDCHVIVSRFSSYLRELFLANVILLSALWMWSHELQNCFSQPNQWYLHSIQVHNWKHKEDKRMNCAVAISAYLMSMSNGVIFQFFMNFNFILTHQLDRIKSF